MIPVFSGESHCLQFLTRERVEKAAEFVERDTKRDGVLVKA